MAEPRVRMGGQAELGEGTWIQGGEEFVAFFAVCHYGHFKQHQNSLCHVIDTPGK